MKTHRFMMEITTVIGCSVNCRFCPQKTLLKAYKSPKRRLCLEDFKEALNRMPNDVIIIFSGFAEPFLNADCAKMILFAHEKGHPISIFTTGMGMSLEDVASIKDIPFSKIPHGGFVLHLPDDEGFADMQITDAYLLLITALKEANIQNFRPISMGFVHKAIRHIFPQDLVRTLRMQSRAGNLNKEGVNANYYSCYHEADVTCGRDEYLFNNVLLPNGDVVLCCQDFGLKHILGNIFKDEYEKILPNPLSSYALCKSCYKARPLNFQETLPKFQLKKK